MSTYDPDLAHLQHPALEHILTEVGSEVLRQQVLKLAGRFKWTPDEVPAMKGQAMLAEECGEVARAALALAGDVQEVHITPTHLERELVQVAAVAVAMIRGIKAGTVTFDA